MIYNLIISNKVIYINTIPLIEFLNNWNNFEIKKNLKIYTIPNTVFCNISGILTIYVINNECYKLLFTSFNAANIYNIQTIKYDFEYTLAVLKNNLKAKYRIINENKYFNKQFTFTLTYNENNFALLISQRYVNEE